MFVSISMCCGGLATAFGIPDMLTCPCHRGSQDACYQMLWFVACEVVDTFSYLRVRGLPTSRGADAVTGVALLMWMALVRPCPPVCASLFMRVESEI